MIHFVEFAFVFIQIRQHGLFVLKIDYFNRVPHFVTYVIFVFHTFMINSFVISRNYLFLYLLIPHHTRRINLPNLITFNHSPSILACFISFSVSLSFLHLMNLCLYDSIHGTLLSLRVIVYIIYINIRQVGVKFPKLVQTFSSLWIIVYILYHICAFDIILIVEVCDEAFCFCVA